MRRLRIGVNALAIRDAAGGAKTYFTQMLSGLLAAMEQQSLPHTLVVFCSQHNRGLFAGLESHPAVEVAQVGGRDASALSIAWRDRVVLRRHVRRNRVDVLWNPAELGSRGTKVPQVVTVHGPLTIPSLRRQTPGGARALGLARRAFYRATLGPSLRRSARVVAISDCVASALAEDFPAVADRIRVVKEGAPEPNAHPPGFRARKSQMLFVSTMYPYKGQEVALEALVRLRQRSVPCSLVFVGRFLSERFRQHLESRVARSGAGADVRFVGSLDAGALAALMDESRVLVHPSYAEGFGLTPLEAMAAGLPCVVSDRMATREISGGGAVVVDPDDIDAWADKIERLLTDAGHWQDVQRRGRSWVAQYRWDACGRDLLQVLTEAVPSPG